MCFLGALAAFSLTDNTLTQFKATLLYSVLNWEIFLDEKQSIFNYKNRKPVALLCKTFWFQPTWSFLKECVFHLFVVKSLKTQLVPISLVEYNFFISYCKRSTEEWGIAQIWCLFQVFAVFYFYFVLFLKDTTFRFCSSAVGGVSDLVLLLPIACILAHTVQ